MFGVLIVSKPEGASLVRQTVVAVLEGKSRVFSRYTNGKQGRGNAWVYTCTVPATGDRVLVGNVVAVAVSPKDEKDWSEAGQPSILFQKLLRAHSLQEQDDVDTDVDAVVNLAYQLGEHDPAEMRRWYSDGRGKKPSQKAVEQPESPYRPVVVRESKGVSRVAQLVSVPSLDNPEIAGYIEREHAGRVTDFDALDFARANGINVSIEGEAGTGKSTLALAYAANRGLDFWAMPSNAGLVIDQVFGGINLATGEWEPGYFTHIWENGGVIELGEVNAMHPRIALQLNPALDARRQLIIVDGGYQRVIDAHPDLLVIATHNPHYRGTSEMNQAFKDRFGMKMVFGYDSSIERRILRSESLVDLAKKMRFDASPEVSYASSGVSYETPISTRLFKNFERIARGLGYEFAVECFVNNFLDEERSSVRTLLEGLEQNIKADLGLLEDSIVLEESDDDFALNA